MTRPCSAPPGLRTRNFSQTPSGQNSTEYARRSGAAKTAAADRDFRLALMQATQTCKLNLPGCAGGKYDPTPTSRGAELPPLYNTARMNRHDGPEDGALADRCLTIGLPEFGAGNGGGSCRRIVQTPGGITMYYDVGQGQGWQRYIV